MKTALLLALALGGVLALTLAGFGPGFFAGLSEISLHGWIAMGAGTILSLALAGGLMALVFVSARRGYDEKAHWDEGRGDEL